MNCQHVYPPFDPMDYRVVVSDGTVTITFPPRSAESRSCCLCGTGLGWLPYQLDGHLFCRHCFELSGLWLYAARRRRESAFPIMRQPKTFFGGFDEFVYYQPPRDSMDSRAVLCREHHVACDCREANWAERINDMLNDMRLERDGMLSRLSEILAGHPVEVCQCTGCLVVRACWMVHEIGILGKTANLRVHPVPSHPLGGYVSLSTEGSVNDDYDY